MLNKMCVFLSLLLPLGANAAIVAAGSTTINFNGSSANTGSSMPNCWSAIPLMLEGGLMGSDVDYYEVTLTEFTSTREDPTTIDFYSEVDNGLPDATQVFQLCGYSCCDGPLDIGVTTNISLWPDVIFFDRLVEGAANQTTSGDGLILFSSAKPGGAFVGGALNVTAFANVSSVPLPAAAWLFMSAIAGLAGAKRLSRSKSTA